MKNQLILFTSFFILTCASCKKDLAPITTVAQMDERLASLLKSSTFPGYAAAVIANDQIVYQNGFGLADIENNKPYNTQTIQPIGSISKTMIAITLMKAIDQNLLTLDTKVNDILPFKIINPNFPNKELTIRHLVTHTSSLLDPDEATRVIQVYQNEKRPTISIKDFMFDYFAKTGKLYNVNNFDKKEPGSTFNYSNYAATLMAYIIEIKTGKTFEEASQFIFDSISMKNTHWFHDDAKVQNYAKLYDDNRKAYPIYTEVTYPEACLKTNVSDLAAFMIEMIKGFNGKSNLLSATSFKAMFSEQFTTSTLPANMNELEPNRGIFWAFGRTGRILHTGGDGGVSAFVSFDPKTSRGRVLLINLNIDEKKYQSKIDPILASLVSFEQNYK